MITIARIRPNSPSGRKAGSDGIEAVLESWIFDSWRPMNVSEVECTVSGRAWIIALEETLLFWARFDQELRPVNGSPSSLGNIGISNVCKFRIYWSRYNLASSGRS